MIIKSLSRKDGSYGSFKQLYDYITRDDGCDQRFNFTQNFILDDRASVLKEFTRNAQLIPNRKNGNFLYHEIISFTRSTKISEQEQLEIIRNVAIRYAQSRAKGCLTFGGVHTDKDNQLHVHMIISANQLEQSNKHSLKIGAYEQIKRNTEAYVLEHHPEMEQDRLINQTSDEKLARSSQREQAYQKRTGKKSDKQMFTEMIEEIMSQASSDEEFRAVLEHHGIEYKYKPAHITLTNPNSTSTRNSHRIKSLGLQDAYKQMVARSEQAELEQQDYEPDEPVSEEEQILKELQDRSSKKRNTKKNQSIKP
jgi:hypothetical protein